MAKRRCEMGTASGSRCKKPSVGKDRMGRFACAIHGDAKPVKPICKHTSCWAWYDQGNSLEKGCLHYPGTGKPPKKRAAKRNPRKKTRKAPARGPAPGATFKKIEVAAEEAAQVAVGLADILGWETLGLSGESEVSAYTAGGDYLQGEHAIRLMLTSGYGTTPAQRAALAKALDGFVAASGKLRMALAKRIPDRNAWTALRVSP